MKKRGGFIEFSIEGPVYLLEAVASFLQELGAGGAIFSELDKPLPGRERLIAFLALDESVEFKKKRLNSFLKKLAQEFPEEKLGELKACTVIDEDWIEKFRQSLDVFQLSGHSWIVPCWMEIPQNLKGEDKIVILLEPGMAFGTGYHPTTRLCALWIDKLVPGEAKSVLDFGTGTGILAMLSAKKGAEEVVAIDIDPFALEVARENIKTNKLEGKIRLLRAPASTGKKIGTKKFELIVANLFFSELIRLKHYIVAHLKKGGFLALSGILPDQQEEIKDNYEELGLELIEAKEEKGWSGILLRKD